MGYAARSAKKKGTRASRPRRSKAESFTGAKENAVEVLRSGELDLMEPVHIPSRDFNSSLGRLREINAKLATLKSAWSNELKKAGDIDEDMPPALKLAIAYDKKSPKQVIRHLQLHGYVLRETGNDIQLTLHDLKMGDSKEVAYQEGFAIGAAGKALPRESKYPINSELDNEFVRGHADGQKRHLPIREVANDHQPQAEAEEPETAFDEEMEREGATAA